MTSVPNAGPAGSRVRPDVDPAHRAEPSRTDPYRGEADRYEQQQRYEPNEQARINGNNARDGFRADPRERSLPALLRDLRDEAVTLVQQEFRLARAEISEEVEEARKAVIGSLTGVALLLVGLFILAIALSAGLYAAFVVGDMDPLLAGWLAPLIIGLTGLIVGLIMVNRVKKVTTAEHWRPSRTEQSVRETVRWAERKF